MDAQVSYYYYQNSVDKVNLYSKCINKELHYYDLIRMKTELEAEIAFIKLWQNIIDSLNNSLK